ncbi:hypothetical protein [Motilimonas pumila]|uniref:Uncharacterized protein n=1 Tax=Motilimonas pumila TaxID=2303987 RepID=A0A418YEG2_9GAMM|nr:hypothetical protein [Motilimonas pumila]RJG47535.1 hypothetical protein D1Z90_10365 [Motilimonas pumila]
MNILNSLDQGFYQTKIHLNDRPYRITDHGEGKSQLLLVNSPNQHALLKLLTGYEQRVILVDLSLAWGHKLDKLSQADLAELCDDIHLLIDIFWLDDLQLESSIDGLNIDLIQDLLLSRRYAKALHLSQQFPSVL